MITLYNSIIVCGDNYICKKKCISLIQLHECYRLHNFYIPGVFSLYRKLDFNCFGRLAINRVERNYSFSCLSSFASFVFEVIQSKNNLSHLPTSWCYFSQHLFLCHNFPSYSTRATFFVPWFSFCVSLRSEFYSCGVLSKDTHGVNFLETI